MVDLEFDKQPLLNTVVDFSNLCNGGIAVSSSNKSNCLSFNYKLTSETSLQIEIPNFDLAHSYQLVISEKLLGVWEESSRMIAIKNLLDEKELMVLNERLSK